MTVERMIELLEIEKECVLRNACGECDRYCAGCDLLQDDTELHEMYTEALALLKAQNKDAEIIRKCREGKVLKHVGDGVVVLNYDWWRKMNEKCDHIKIVPSVEDLLKAQEPRVLTLAELRALPEEPQTPLAMEERVPIGTWDGGSVVRWLDSAFVQEMYVDDGTVYTNAGTYGKLWRVWTAWPDKAMREAEPWN